MSSRRQFFFFATRSAARASSVKQAAGRRGERAGGGAVAGDHAAERGDGVALEGGPVRVGERGRRGDAARREVLDDDDRRLFETHRGLPRRVKVKQVVVRGVLALQDRKSTR